MSRLKDGQVRKSILRNVEIPVKKPKDTKDDHNGKQVRINTRPMSGTKPKGENTKPDNSNTDKYTKPTINSSARYLKKIEDAKKGIGFNKKAEECVDPATIALMKKRLTQKLNFPPDRSVFHGLCPINVNDSVLEIDVVKKNSKRYSMPKHRLEKDPEPKLQDFLDPVLPFGETKRGNKDSNINMTQYARFVNNVPLKHQPPSCTTLENAQMIFDLFL